MALAVNEASVEALREDSIRVEVWVMVVAIMAVTHHIAINTKESVSNIEDTLSLLYIYLKFRAKAKVAQLHSYPHRPIVEQSYRA